MIIGIGMSGGGIGGSWSRSRYRVAETSECVTCGSARNGASACRAAASSELAQASSIIVRLGICGPICGVRTREPFISRGACRMRSRNARTRTPRSDGSSWTFAWTTSASG
ncbi:hypothetical protein DDP54_06705 [Cellulomonas sp. WB94]|nr:hypothetical protein DDP54_06705 [Cellulomonas sp. WB94]